MSGAAPIGGPSLVEAARRLARTTDPYAARLTGAQRDALTVAVVDDLTSEYDARFLSTHLAGLPYDLPAGFGPVIERWRADEERHFRASYEVAVRHFDFDPATLSDRRADFDGIAHLFEGPFETLVLLAYDELVTVRGYRGNFPLYELLGPAFAAWMRTVTADEARHYAAFLGLLVAELPHELDRARDVVARIRGTEGEAYQATFVLDHDDPVYGAELFDQAARLLLGQLERAGAKRGTENAARS